MDLWLIHFDNADDDGEATRLFDLKKGDWGEGIYCIVEAEDEELAVDAGRFCVSLGQGV